MVKPKMDPRVERTRRLIRETFRQLVCERDYEEITVRELTERAGISRKTFYLHYQDLDDLLREFQSELADAFVKRTANLRRPEDMDQITREFFLHSESLGRLAEKLVCSDSYNYIGSRITSKIMDETWGQDEGPLQRDPALLTIISTFTAQATLAIYRRWVADGRKLPLEEIIDLTTRLICGGLAALETSGGQERGRSAPRPAEPAVGSDGELDDGWAIL